MATPRPIKEVLTCYAERRKRVRFTDDPTTGTSVDNLKRAIAEVFRGVPGFQERRMVLQVF